ncbi:MAG: PAS domain-containing protein [Asticcacaulis sp.]|uniref:PAS domain-containing protein n=1 Tax=Asticcacaulis sp. TaxID=1872648 RepID=UPI003F7BB7E3
MLLQNEHDLVLLLGAAAAVLLVLAILGGLLAALKTTQVRQFQDLLFKAERKIDTLERRMFNVLNAVPVALVETDATGKFTFANRAAHQLLGRKDNELLGLRFHSATWGITYPDGRVIAADLLPIARTLRGQTVKGFQHMLTRYGAREKILVSVTSMPVMNSVGEVIGSSAAFVELETTQGEGIDDLNGLWRGHWFEAASLPFWGLDASGKVVDLNAAALSAFDVTREQALGVNWTQDFVPEAEFQAAMDYLAGVQGDSDGHAVSRDLSLRSPRTGEAAPMRVTAWRVRTQEGGAEGLTVMALPLADMAASPVQAADPQEAEELADHRAAEQTRAALGVGVWHYDPAADVIVEDDGLRRLIGREVEGGPTRIAAEDQARADQAFGALMNGERDEIALDMPVTQSDGGVRWISLQGRAETTPDGQRRLYGVAYDITPWRDAPKPADDADGLAAALAEAEAQHQAALAALQTHHEAAVAEAFAQGRAEAMQLAAEEDADTVYAWRDAPVAAPDPALIAENATLKQRLAALEDALDAARSLQAQPDPRLVELEAELAAAHADNEELRKRQAAMAAAPPPEPDTRAYDARIQELEDDLAESRNLLALLQRRYVALAEAPAPQPDYAPYEAQIKDWQDRFAALQTAHAELTAAHEALRNAPAPEPDASAWQAKLHAAQAKSAKLQAAFDAAQAELQTRPAVDPATETRLADLQNALETAQGEADAARTRLNELSEALNAAQRFETVGRLTADVAQDFAQMLGVINGALEVMAKQENSPDNLRRLSEAALAAGKRGERLTRQLQAFQSEEF